MSVRGQLSAEPRAHALVLQPCTVYTRVLSEKMLDLVL